MKKKKGDSYSKHSGSKEKLKLRMAQVKPVWTKYFELELAAEEEDSASGEDTAQLDDMDENNEIASC